MVNIISPSTRARLSLRYYARLATVLFLTVGVAAVVGILLVLPSYFFIHADADQAAEYVTTVREIANQRAKGQAQDTLATFNEGVKLLAAAERKPALAHLLGVLTSDLPRGLSIDKVDVFFNETGNAAIQVAGTASTRAELIAYSNLLKDSKEFKSVEVPVSNLVADVDSEFSVSVVWERPQTP